MKEPLKIPFTEDGVMLDWISPPSSMWKYTRDNFEFDSVMTIVGTRRGRSAAKFVLKDAGGRPYTMFMSEMLNMAKNAIIRRGSVEGTWTFCKRGENYSLRWVR